MPHFEDISKIVIVDVVIGIVLIEEVVSILLLFRILL